MSRIAGAWFVARKDLQYLFRTKDALLWVFIMPVVFCYLIGTMTSGFIVRYSMRRTRRCAP